MKKLHRQSIRLRGYDYTSRGAYFMTICCYQRQALFGEILENKMQLNRFGEIVLEEWEISAQRRKELTLGRFVIMPNHVHGIVWLHSNNVSVGNSRQHTEKRVNPVGAQRAAPLHDELRINEIQGVFNSLTNVVPKSLGAFVRAFKSAATKRINESRGTPKFPVWQRNYHEHIVRNDASLERIENYIVNNPSTWQQDCFFVEQK